jgi:hypothetical protein
MKAYLNLAASGLALALASTAASAQTVVSRSITAEPVETTVTETPTGTIVTRRPLAQQPAPLVAPQLAAQAFVQPTAPAPALVETVPNTVNAITTREVVQRAEAERAAPAMTTRQVSAERPARHASPRQTVHKSTRTTRAIRTSRARTTHVAAAAPRLVLGPRERHIVYQTIVERQVVPRQQVIVAPPMAPALAFVAPQVMQPPIVAADEIEATPITVGTVLPANVPLYAIPENIALSIPATQSYSYAYLGGRAYLVDPASGTVVADVTE